MLGSTGQLGSDVVEAFATEDVRGLAHDDLDIGDAAAVTELLDGLRPRLVTDQDNLPGSRLLDGNFTAVQQAAGTPKGRPAGARYLGAFIEDIKATGLVARTIAKHNVRGLTVAPQA